MHDTYFPCIKIKPLNAELNSIRHLLALLGDHHIFSVSGLRFNMNANATWSFLTALKIKVKVKVTLQQSTNTQSGSRGIALLFV